MTYSFQKKSSTPCLYYLVAVVAIQSLSCVWLFVTPWTIDCHAPLSMGFSRQEYWNGLLFPSPRIFPDEDQIHVSCIGRILCMHIHTHALKNWLIKYILWILFISINTLLLWIYSHLNDIIVFYYLLISFIKLYQTYYQTLILWAWDTNMLEKDMSLLYFSHVLF